MTATRGSACARALAVVALVVSSSTLAWAQPKTDVVRLANGDHVTGEIVDLNRGRLELKTDDAGTIEFEWDNIASVESTRQFEIETSDGRRMLGTLQLGVERFIRVVTASGDVTLSISEVTTLHPIGANFWKRLDGGFNLGYSYTRSSGIGQLSLNTESTFRRPAFLVTLAISGTLTEQPGVEKDDRASLNLGYVRYRGRWLVGAGGSFENNESLGIVLRSQVGGMVGRRLVNTNRAQLQLAGGLVVNNEEGVDVPNTQNLEGLASFRSSFFTYDGSKTNFSARLDYYPSFSSWGRQRLQFDCSLSQTLWKDFAFSINVFDTFDSAPPDPNAARNDAGIVTSIGWTY
jgi:hypothetical protein